MNSFLRIERILAIVIFFAICFLAYQVPAFQNKDGDGVFWFSILPPLLTVTISLVTGRLITSLLAGIFSGAFLAVLKENLAADATWNLASVITSGTSKTFHSFYDSLSDVFYIEVLAFILFFLTMIGVMIVSGGLKGVVDRVAQYANTRRRTKMITFILGLIIFIDDYANSMIIGGAMRPLSDRYRISREKLSFIVDATSAPVAGIAFISTWIGYEVGQFSDVAKTLSIDKTGYGIFLDAFQFRYYCFFMIVFVFLNCWTEKDFGPMKRAERRAIQHGKVHGERAKPMTSGLLSDGEPDSSARVDARTALVPLGALFTILLGGLWLDGGGGEFFAKSPFYLLNPGVWMDVISKSENNVRILAVAGFFGLVFALAFGKFLARVDTRVLWHTVLKGLRAAVLPTSILILAWALKNVCGYVHTDQFLVSVLGDRIAPWIFPFFVFITASLTAFATGTSWGTMAILIPTVAPVAYVMDGSSYGLITMITLGSILDGAILGDHCSPISDTTVMSSIATGCDHMDHVRTQIPYSAFVGGVALLCGYLPAALGLPTGWALLLGCGVMTGFFTFLRK